VAVLGVAGFGNQARLVKAVAGCQDSVSSADQLTGERWRQVYAVSLDAVAKPGEIAALPVGDTTSVVLAERRALATSCNQVTDHVVEARE